LTNYIITPYGLDIDDYYYYYNQLNTLTHSKTYSITRVALKGDNC